MTKAEGFRAWVNNNFGEVEQIFLVSFDKKGFSRVDFDRLIDRLEDWLITYAHTQKVKKKRKWRLFLLKNALRYVEEKKYGAKTKKRTKRVSEFAGESKEL